MKALVVLNDPPYGTERSYNGLRLASTLAKREIACCGSCLDARGIGEERLVAGARRSSIEELTDWTAWADQVLVF